MASKKFERRLRQATARYETADAVDRMTDRGLKTAPNTRRQNKIKNLNARAEVTVEAKAERVDLSHHKDPHSVARSKYLLKNVINPNVHPHVVKWQ